MTTKLKQTLGTILFLLIALIVPIVIFSFKYPKLWDFRLDGMWKISGFLFVVILILFFVFRKFIRARIKALTYGFWKTFFTVAPAIMGSWILYGLVYAIYRYFQAFNFVVLVVAICETVAWGAVYPFLMFYDHRIIQEQREAATISALKKAGLVTP